MNPQIPSTIETVDQVFLYIFGISALLLIGITATMIYFIVRYHWRRHPHAEPSPRYNIWLEITWTTIPTLIVLGMFWYGWNGYLTLLNVPENALDIEVTARKWDWTFTYENGKTSNRLVVPAKRPIRLAITSLDVVHSLYIPAFRIKKDALPGFTTYVWFEAPRADTYDLFCAEYCGVAHSSMITVVEALPEERFSRWLVEKAEKEADGEAEPGRELLTRHGCNACHSLDGTKMIGPTFKGLFGHTVTVTTDGRKRELTVDRDYLRRSILEPGADLVEGYPPVMPPYQGRISDEELDALVEFLAEQTGNGT
ncbi:MAG: cytochrome c oxidase subunit II [Syntrophotaleaceae bacterium]